jgi:hypothetical protein
VERGACNRMVARGNAHAKSCVVRQTYERGCATQKWMNAAPGTEP